MLRNRSTSSRALVLGLVTVGVLGCEGLAGLDEFVDRDGGTAAGTHSGTSTGTGTGTAQGGATASGSGTGAGGGFGGGGGADPLCVTSTSHPDLIYFTTLDDPPSFLTPAVGSGQDALIHTTPPNHFVPGRCGGAVQIDEEDEYLRGVNQTNLISGTITFWYRSVSDASPDTIRRLFSSFAANTPGVVRLLWTPSAGFSVRIRDSHDVTHHTTVGPAETPFVLNQWVHVGVTWDTQRAGQLARIFFDGVEPAQYASSPSGPIDTPPTVSGPRMHIGAWTNVPPGLEPAMGLIDEFAIYRGVVLP